MNFDDFKQELKTFTDRQIAFIGLGNELRGDDGAGLLFLKYLRRAAEFQRSFFVCAGTNPENYLQTILDSKAQLAVFIDAARWGAKPGEIAWLSADQIDAVGISTHAYSIRLVEKYLKAQQDMAFKYLVIEPLTMQLNTECSPIVRKRIKIFFDPEQID